MMELRGEIGELKREKQLIKSTARATESEIQRKLGVRVEIYLFEYCHLHCFVILGNYWSNQDEFGTGFQSHTWTLRQPHK